MSKLKLNLKRPQTLIKRQAQREGLILIVDDEQANLDGLEAVLSARYEVKQTTSAHEALTLTQQHKVDLIITDQRMPEMLGTELLQAIFDRDTQERNTEELKTHEGDERVDHLNILLTGYTDIDDLITCINDGLLYRYLVKPWSPAELLATVEQAFDKLKTDRELISQHELLRREVEERRRAQEELEVALFELKRAQETLIAQEKLRALGEMVSGVAHDFSNVLTPVMVYSEELLEGCDEGEIEQRDMLRGIHNAAQDGAELIRRLKASYHPHYQAKSVCTPITLLELVQGAVTLALPRWPSSLTTPLIKLEVPPELMVCVSVSPFRQALVNVICNALDAMSDKAQQLSDDPQRSNAQLTLTVRAEPHASQLSLEIIDEGVGMSAGVLAQCQKAFFSTKGEAGTGLGLAMVGETLAQHQGALSLSSDLGVGTTVRLTLPLHQGSTS